MTENEALEMPCTARCKIISLICITVSAHINVLGTLEGLFFLLILVLPCCKTIPTISTIEFNDFNDTRFVLYLRGFVDDIIVDNINVDDLNVNEDYSYDALDYISSQGITEESIVRPFDYVIPIYAVGYPQELYSPLGAVRIYINQENWESQVEVLMEKATLLIIRLHDSISCVKEIALSQKYKYKTIYVITDKAKFDKIKKTLFNQYGVEWGESIDFTSHNDTYALVMYNNGSEVVKYISLKEMEKQLLLDASRIIGISTVRIFISTIMKKMTRIPFYLKVAPVIFILFFILLSISMYAYYQIYFSEYSISCSNDSFSFFPKSGEWVVTLFFSLLITTATIWLARENE